VAREQQDAYLDAELAPDFARARREDLRNANAERREYLLREYPELDEEVAQQVILLCQGKKELDKGDLANAIRVLTEATRAKSGRFEYLVYHTLGLVHEKLLRDANELGKDARGQVCPYSAKNTDFLAAVAMFRKAISLNGHFAPPYYDLAFLCEGAGCYEEAVEACNSLILLAPRSARAYCLRANAQTDLGKGNLALNDFRESVRLNPIDPETYVQMGQAYRDFAEYERAVESYQKAVALNFPYPWGIHQSIGSCYESLGRDEKAIASYEEAMRAPGYPQDWAPGLRQKIARCRERLAQKR
jgi:tetratricopeptide (TPR) repeat protein